MTVSNQNDYWTARLNGGSPASPVGSSEYNTAWTLTGGHTDDGVANTGGFWRVSSSSGVKLGNKPLLMMIIPSP